MASVKSERGERERKKGVIWKTTLCVWVSLPWLALSHLSILHLCVSVSCLCLLQSMRGRRSPVTVHTAWIKGEGHFICRDTASSSLCSSLSQLFRLIAVTSSSYTRLLSSSTQPSPIQHPRIRQPLHIILPIPRTTDHPRKMSPAKGASLCRRLELVRAVLFFRRDRYDKYDTVRPGARVPYNISPMLCLAQVHSAGGLLDLQEYKREIREDRSLLRRRPCPSIYD
jgi:hypothetical protein